VICRRFEIRTMVGVQGVVWDHTKGWESNALVCLTRFITIEPPATGTRTRLPDYPYPGTSSEKVLRRVGRNRSYQARRRRRPAKISVLSSQKRTAAHRPALLTSVLEARFHWFADPCDTFSSHFVPNLLKL
jgi:hypothetical protein